MLLIDIYVYIYMSINDISTLLVFCSRLITLMGVWIP